MIKAHHTATKHPLQMTKEKDFEELYLFVREKERRLYMDEQVAALPMIHPYHIHFEEWQIRKRSADRLFSYLQQKEKPLSILEVGCGNGWLIASLADIEDSLCTGIDVNTMELEQAKRVFDKRKNLSFFKADISSQHRLDNKYDIIIFAASIQYFASFDLVMTAALNLLTENGEIHILDSPFYTDNTIGKAKDRTKNYYQSIGCPDMAMHYHHHLHDSLNRYHHSVLYNPNSFVNKWLYGKNFFPWIAITSHK